MIDIVDISSEPIDPPKRRGRRPRDPNAPVRHRTPKVPTPSVQNGAIEDTMGVIIALCCMALDEQLQPTEREIKQIVEPAARITSRHVEVSNNPDALDGAQLATGLAAYGVRALVTQRHINAQRRGTGNAAPASPQNVGNGTGRLDGAGFAGADASNGNVNFASLYGAPVPVPVHDSLRAAMADAGSDRGTGGNDGE